MKRFSRQITDFELWLCCGKWVIYIYISSLLCSVHCKNLSKFGMCVNRLTFAEWQTRGLTSCSCSSIAPRRDHLCPSFGDLVQLTASHSCTLVFVSCLFWFGGFTDRDVIYGHADSNDHHSEVSGSRHRFYWPRRLKNSSYFQSNLMASNLKRCLTQSLPYSHFAILVFRITYQLFVAM